MRLTYSRAVWIDSLRSFITLLVVAHHAALAYATFSHFDPNRYINSTAPIVDANRWLVMDIFISFNDLFFMPLMFLISGLFVYQGIRRKGAKAYLSDRFIRLGIPFIVAELLLIPLAYFPSFYEATRSTNLINFIHDYLSNQQWPVGPPWFIWLLFAFDLITVLLLRINSAVIPTLGRQLSRLSKQPILFGVLIYGLASATLIPLSLWVGQYTWVGNWGPFDFQLNRLLFYFLFFLLGVCLGSTNWQLDFFRQDKLFGKHWMVWLLFSIGSYLLVMFVSTFGADWVRQGSLSSRQGHFIYDLTFVLSCLASLAACVSFFRQKMTFMNEGWVNLSANAYGIYVVHYLFVTWLQFGLLGSELPASMKFLFVFAGSVGLSWVTINLSRKSPLIARVL